MLPNSFMSAPFLMKVSEVCGLTKQAHRNTGHTVRLLQEPSQRYLCEIMNAVSEVVFEEFSLPMAKIPSLTARKLGFSSTGSKISETINAVVEMMLRDGRIKDTMGLISITNN